jgi:hypothetical protein
MMQATSNEEEVDVKLTNNVSKVNTIIDGMLEKGEYRQLVDFEDHMDTASTAEVCAKEKVFDFRNSFVSAAASGL